MNKKNLTLTLSGAIATTLFSVAPAIQAGENPFALSSISNASTQMVADNTSNAEPNPKINEGKCGEGKCGASKAKTDKTKEATCGAKTSESTDKAPEAKCGAKKPAE